MLADHTCLLAPSIALTRSFEKIVFFSLSQLSSMFHLLIYSFTWSTLAIELCSLVLLLFIACHITCDLLALQKTTYKSSTRGPNSVFCNVLATLRFCSGCTYKEWRPISQRTTHRQIAIILHSVSEIWVLSSEKAQGSVRAEGKVIIEGGR